VLVVSKLFIAHNKEKKVSKIHVFDKSVIENQNAGFHTQNKKKVVSGSSPSRLRSRCLRKRKKLVLMNDGIDVKKDVVLRW